MIRWRFDFDTRHEKGMRIEIDDRDYSDPPIVYDIAGEVPVKVNFGDMNADPARKIMGSSIEVEFVGQTGDFDDLYIKDNERFKMFFYIDDQLESVFIPIPDTMSEPFTPGLFTVHIQGSNLSILKQYDAIAVLSAFEKANFQASGSVMVTGSVEIDAGIISAFGSVMVTGSVDFENLANAQGSVMVTGNVTQEIIFTS